MKIEKQKNYNLGNKDNARQKCIKTHEKKCMKTHDRKRERALSQFGSRSQDFPACCDMLFMETNAVC